MAESNLKESGGSKVTLGEKIRSLRRSAGMTQTALAGSQITRNMLSQIENNIASPSLQTINYIARKLGVSAGYLIAEGKDDKTLKKASELDEIKKELLSRNYDDCIEHCLSLFQNEDDELNLLLAEAYYRSAFDDYKHGKLQISQKKLLTALKHSGSTVYNTDRIKSGAAILLRFMNESDPNLPIIDVGKLAQDSGGSSLDMFIYEKLIGFMNSGHIPETEAIINAKLLTSEIYNNHITAKLMMARGDYSVARMLLESTLAKYDPFEIGAIMMLRLYSELEICHTHENNFEGAYNCASNKLAIMAAFRS